MPNFDITTLIDHFEVHNRTEGKSPRTVEWYNEVLRLFLDWLTKSGLSTSLDQIGEPFLTVDRTFSLSISLES